MDKSELESIACEKVKKTIRENNIAFIKLGFVDLDGNLKMVEVSSTQLDRMLHGKIMIDGSSIKGFGTVHSSDVMLAPDLDSFKVLPFLANDKYNVGMLMCDVTDTQGTPTPTCTRSALKKVLMRAQQHKIDTINIGFEPEFYLYKNGKVIDTHGYCSSEDKDGGSGVRREIMWILSQIGISPCTSHHENGPGQQEITYEHTDALTACDNLLLIKMIVHIVASQHGLSADFSPKPIKNEAGNGLHTNISLETDNENVFWDNAHQELSITAHQFIEGILTCARGLSYLTNPTPNSYARLGFFEAPRKISAGKSDRSSMIRIPDAGSQTSARIEVRSVDASANPYLALCGIISAGMHAVIKARADKTDADRVTAYNHEMRGYLPKNITKARTAFLRDEILTSAISLELANALCK